METTFENVNYLTKEEILKINKQTILHGGGWFVCKVENVRKPVNLEYMVEAVKGNILTFEVYQTILAKAAFYDYSIAKGSLFFDGNKRTGLESAIVFIERNGYEMKDSVLDEDMVSLGLDIANGIINLEGITEWFTVNTIGG